MDHERARSRLAAAAGLLAGLGLLIGVPAALAAFVGWPLPTTVPSVGAARDAFDRGDVDPQVLINALAVVVWVAWAQLAFAIVVEAAAHARGQVARARTLLPGTQLLARQLVASAALAITTLAPARGAVAAPLEPTVLVHPDTPSLNAEAPPGPAEAPTPARAPATRSYTVEAGDTWWGLAQRFLGSGTRWREVRDLNIGRTVAPGHTLAAGDDTLLAGWSIAIPGPPAAPLPETGEQVVAGQGDDLWSLATGRLQAALGREPTDAELGAYWQATLEANTALPSGDPNVIAVGQHVTLPPPPQTPPAPEPGPGSGEQVITVAPGDNPWSLAEAHLGDGKRWPELIEANKGRTQPDGHTVVDEHTLLPGWQLVVPHTASLAPPAQPPAPPAQPAPVGPPTAGASADAELAGPADGPGPGPAPTSRLGDRPADTAREANRDTGRDAPTAPEAAREAPAPPSTAAPTSTAAPVAPAGTTAQAPTGQGSGQDRPEVEATDEDVPVAPILGVAGTVLAVGVLRSLRRRRGRRAAQLPVAVVPPPPPREARPAAQEVLAAADEAAVDRLDAALAHLAAGLRPRGGEPCPQPRLVQVTGDRVEVLLDRAEPAPPRPWRPEASGMVWVLDADAEVAAGVEAAPPLPALVTIGTGEADILIDLEAFGVISLVGDPDSCWALARSMVTELAARAEGTLGIEVVGIEDPHLGSLDGVRSLADWDDVDDTAITSSTRMLDAGRWPHTFAARASGRVFDGWPPAVFITGPCDHPRFRAAVEQVDSRPGTGSAIVVAAADTAVGYGTEVVLDATGRFHIPALGLSGQAQLLGADAVAQVVDLLEDADHAEVAQTFEFPDTTTTTDTEATGADEGDDGPDVAPRPAPSLAPTGAAYEDPPWDVLVRVCGEVHVQGGSDRLPARETAVATYVALNRSADIDQIRDAIWAGADVTRKRVQNVVSNVRRTLGDAIYFVDEGRLAAGPRLLTDTDLIQRRLAYARHQGDATARAETLRGALEWATGKVCTYPSTARRSWAWIDLDNWISNVESLVGTVAHELATTYLGLGDSEGATWAARRGIDATGPREQLTLLLVRGYELAGDAPAAAAALRSYERFMDELGADGHSEALLEAMDRYLAPRPGRAAS